MRISKADELLLSLLREDARASTAEIARRLGLSRTTVQNRITRLEQEGVIRGYTGRVDDELEEARWFTREEIGAALHRDGSEPDGGDPGAISLAPAISIARSLIRDWYRHGPMLTPA